MKKSRPKSAMRPSSAVKNQSLSTKKNDKIGYQTAKRFIQYSDKYQNMVVLEKPNLLPILSTYQPRILKHIIISDQKSNLSKTSIKKVTKHKNCQVHQINIKSAISYFVQWKRVMRQEMAGFQSLLNKIGEGGEVKDIRRIREQLVGKLQKIKGINQVMGKQLQQYIEKQGEHYILQRIQTHLQYPPYKPQPLGKQSHQITTQKNHNKIAQIYNDYDQYRRITNSILEIFQCLKRVTRVSYDKEREAGLVDGQKQEDGILFQQVEAMLVGEMKNGVRANNDGNSNKNNIINNTTTQPTKHHTSSSQTIDNYRLKTSHNLWQVIEAKIYKAFTQCNLNNNNNDNKNNMKSSNPRQTNTKIIEQFYQQGQLGNVRSFMVTDKVMRMASSSTAKKNVIDGGKKSQMTKMKKQQLLLMSKKKAGSINNMSNSKSNNRSLLATSLNSQIKLSQQSPSSYTLNTTTNIINLTFVQFRLKKFFPLMIQSVVDQIRHQVQYKQLLLQYGRYIDQVKCKVVKDLLRGNDRGDFMVIDGNNNGDGDGYLWDKNGYNIRSNKSRLELVKRNSRKYQFFMSTIKKLLTNITNFTLHIKQLQQHRYQHNQCPKQFTNNTTTKQTRTQQITKHIQSLTITLQLSFIQILISFFKQIELQQSVLELMINDGNKVYDRVRQLMIVMGQVGMVGWWGVNGNVQGEQNDYKLLFSSQLVSFITRSLRQYSPFMRNVIQIQTDINLIKRNNNIIMTNHHQHHKQYKNNKQILSSQQITHTHNELIKFFNSLKQTILTFLQNKQKLTKWLRQNVVGQWWKKRGNLVKEKVHLGQQSEQQLTIVIKTTIQRIESFTLKNTNNLSSQQQQTSNQLNSTLTTTSQQLNNINQLITLIQQSHKISLQHKIFINPQQYFQSLIQTILPTTGNISNENSSNKNILSHNKLISDIYQFKSLYKQFMGLLMSCQLIQYVIKKQQLGKRLVQQIMIRDEGSNSNNNNNGFLLLGLESRVGNKQHSVKKLTKYQEQTEGIKGNIDQKINKVSIQLQLPFLFPKVPMVINTPQYQQQQQNVEVSQQQSKQIKHNNNPTILTLPIHYILTHNIFIHSFPLIQQTHQHLTQLHKLVGDTIDNLQQFQQLNKFNQWLQQQIQTIKQVWYSDRLIRFVNQMVRLVVRQWQGVMRWNQFLSGISLQRFVGIVEFCNNYYIKQQQQRRSTTTSIQSIKSYLNELYNMAIKIQPTYTPLSNNNILNKNNKSIQLLQQVLKQLQIRKYDKLKCIIIKFLQQNGVKLIQYGIVFNYQTTNTKDMIMSKVFSTDDVGILTQSDKRSILTVLYKKPTTRNNNKKRIKKQNQSLQYQISQSQQRTKQQLNVIVEKNNLSKRQLQIQNKLTNRIAVSLRLDNSDLVCLLRKYLPRVLGQLQQSIKQQQRQVINNNSNHSVSDSRTDMQYINHHFRTIQSLIIQLITLLNKINKNINTKQQSHYIQQKTINNIINDINIQLLSFLKLLAKVVVYYDSWFINGVVEDFINCGGKDEDEGYRYYLLERIRELVEGRLVSCVMGVVMNKDGYEFVKQSQNNYHKNINTQKVIFIQPLHYEQEQKTQKIINNNNNKNYNTNQKLSQQQQHQPKTISHNQLYNQLTNLIQLLSNYHPLHKQQLQFITIELEKRFIDFNQQKQKQIIMNRKKDGDCCCFGIVVIKENQLFDRKDKIILNKKQNCLDDNNNQLDVLQLVEEYLLLSLYKQSQSINNNNSKSINPSSIHTLPITDIQHLSKIYTKLSTTTSTKSPSTTNPSHKTYLTKLTINTDLLLRQFILKELMIKDNKLLVMEFSDRFQQFNRQRYSKGLYMLLIKQLIDCVNYNSVYGDGKKQQVYQHVNDNSNKSKIISLFNQFMKNFNLIRHFYSNHYKRFTQYFNNLQLLQQLSLFNAQSTNNKRKRQTNINNKQQQFIHELQHKIQELLSIWQCLQQFVIKFISDEGNRNNSRLNILNSKIFKSNNKNNIQCVKYIYDIVKKLIITESTLWQCCQQLQYNIYNDNNNRICNHFSHSQRNNQLLLIGIMQTVKGLDDSNNNRNKNIQQQMIGMLLLSQSSMLQQKQFGSKQQKQVRNILYSTIKSHNQKQRSIFNYINYNNKMIYKEIYNNDKFTSIERFLFYEYFWKLDDHIFGKMINLQSYQKRITKQLVDEFRQCVVITYNERFQFKNGKNNINKTINRSQITSSLPLYKQLTCTINSKFIILHLSFNQQQQTANKINNNNLNNNKNQQLNQTLLEWDQKVNLFRREYSKMRQLMDEVDELGRYVKWRYQLIMDRRQKEGLQMNKKELVELEKFINRNNVTNIIGMSKKNNNNKEQQLSPIVVQMRILQQSIINKNKKLTKQQQQKQQQSFSSSDNDFKLLQVSNTTKNVITTGNNNNHDNINQKQQQKQQKQQQQLSQSIFSNIFNLPLICQKIKQRQQHNFQMRDNKISNNKDVVNIMGDDNSMRLLEFKQQQQLISKVVKVDKITSKNNKKYNLQNLLSINLTALEQLTKTKQHIHSYNLSKSIISQNNLHEKYIKKYINNQSLFIQHLLLSLLCYKQNDYYNKSRLSEIKQLLIINGSVENDVINKCNNKKSDNGNNNSWQWWWQHLIVETIIEGNNSDQTKIYQRKLFNYYHNIISNNNQSQQPNNTNIIINQLIKTFINQLQQYTSTQYKWLTQQQKLSQNKTKHEIQMFTKFLQNIILTLTNYINTDVFIPVMNQMSSQRDKSKYNKNGCQFGVVNVRYDVRADDSTTTNGFDNNILTEIDKQQINCYMPFTIIQSPILINNKQITKHQFIQKIFTQYILKFIINKQQLQSLQTITLQLKQQNKLLKQGIERFYSSLQQKQKEEILRWSINKLQHQRQQQQKVDKQLSIKILFMILVKWAEVIQNYRRERYQQKQLQQQQARQKDNQKKKRQQQQQYNQKLIKQQKQKKQISNLLNKQKLRKITLIQQQSQSQSQTSSQLQIQFALSDAWGVDNIEFIQQLQQYKKQKFMKIENRILQNDYLNQSFIHQSQSDISVNMSENNLQFNTNIQENNFFNPIIKPKSSIVDQNYYMSSNVNKVRSKSINSKLSK